MTKMSQFFYRVVKTRNCFVNSLLVDNFVRSLEKEMVSPMFLNVFSVSVVKIINVLRGL